MTATTLTLNADQKVTQRDQFKHDVIKGLTSTHKYLDAKYFYDDRGDKLFQEIMDCPEYYPTKCELEIFESQTSELCAAITGDGSPFDLIELGAGDATKSSYLLKKLLEEKADFTYLPIDISENVISYLNATLPVKLPGLKIKGLNGEYFDMLKRAASMSKRRKVVLFLGSNVGNMPIEAAQEFCEVLRQHLSPGDMALIGIDLKKNPEIILSAYNDTEGITRLFNLNLLQRINRELGADFNLDQFEHYPTYDPETGACKSYLISLTDQQVLIDHQCINFTKDEYIFMEVSQKYSIQQVNQLADQSGFKPIAHFYDQKRWFVDTVWLAD